MTTGEFIELLKQMDPDLDIFVCSPDQEEDFFVETVMQRDGEHVMIHTAD